jgi:hypothetical protein
VEKGKGKTLAKVINLYSGVIKKKIKGKAVWNSGSLSYF